MNRAAQRKWGGGVAPAAPYLAFARVAGLGA